MQTLDLERRCPRAGLVMLGLLAASIATAPMGEAASTRRVRPRPQAPAAAETKAWRGDRAIAIDGKTVRKPTPDEARALAGSLRAMLNRSSEGLEATSRADGVRQVSLQGRFSNVVLARPLPDGTMETRCVTTFEEATAFLGLSPESGEPGSATE
jgi:hypothetical protein